MKQSIVHIPLVVREYDEAIEFYTKKIKPILNRIGKTSMRYIAYNS